MSKVYDFLKECIPFWVSTVNGDVPAARPFGGIMEYEGNLYIPSGVGKDVYEQMKKNPSVQITALKPGTRTWIRISGIVAESDSLKEKEAMFEACPALYKLYGTPEAPGFALFRIEKKDAFLYTDQGVSRLEN